MWQGTLSRSAKDVTRFQPGDEVFGIGKAAFAEYVCVLKSVYAYADSSD